MTLLTGPSEIPAEVMRDAVYIQPSGSGKIRYPPVVVLLTRSSAGIQRVSTWSSIPRYLIDFFLNWGKS
jgi:hypothetical protein